MIVGIDISKLKLDVMLLLENGKEKHRTFSNNAEGYKMLAAWLKQHGADKAHVCLEATGIYGEKVSLFLHQQVSKVSIVNPARIKAYGRSEGLRTKTDKVDCGVIARFCKAQCPQAWEPASQEEQLLRDSIPLPSEPFRR